jgi:hypothetical protein
VPSLVGLVACVNLQKTEQLQVARAEVLYGLEVDQENQLWTEPILAQSGGAKTVLNVEKILSLFTFSSR